MTEDRIVISHVRKDGAPQLNEEHQQGVARLAAGFAAEFGFGDFGRLMGLLHDKGKEQDQWQKYIRGVTGYNKEYAHIKQGPSHAYVGALIAHKLYPKLASLLAYPILGHHAGLYDYMDYDEVMKSKSIPTDVDTPKQEVPFPSMNLKSIKPYECNHIIRMLFSCLVDADRLDTEAFITPEQAVLRRGKKKLQELVPLLEEYLANLQSKIKREHKEGLTVNVVRKQVQEECRKESAGEPGFYSLTVPTGGGKTLSSLVWAIYHAIHHNKKRIVIAIPYTSIIVQTAQILRTIFGVENVLEHHSNVSYESLCDKDDKEEDKLALQMKLATENWDYPIIVTTNVQLFESMYSNRPTPCRKLHNLSNSVLILDEVQTLPINYLQPIVNVLKTYQSQFGMSVLFTTASQPILEGEHRGCNPQVVLKGIEKITEIIPKDYALQDKLRRVRLHFDEQRSTYDDIATRLAQYDRVLCVVNTRKDAAEIYNRLPKDDDVLTLHLSRMMCPIHVSETITKIKEALDKQKKIRVVSTQLIEAGVDIDFPVVFRQEAGLDSILQAAGRCNREGKLGVSDTYVFMLAESVLRGFINRANDARIDISRIVDDKLSPLAIKKYFQKLYSYSPTFDIKNSDDYSMFDMLEEVDSEEYISEYKMNLPKIDYRFRMAANSFRLVNDEGIGIIVHYVTDDEMLTGKKPLIETLIDRLEKEGPSYSLMKELSQYTVNIRKNDFNKLVGVLYKEEAIPPDINYIKDVRQYDRNVGILTKNHWIDEILIIGN